MEEFRKQLPKNIASVTYSVEESTAGTAIILDKNNRNYLLLTANHVVSFPDTAAAYIEGNGMPKNTFLKSISVKKRQTNLVYTGQEIKSFELIAASEQQDLALLNIELEKSSNLDPYQLNLNFGNTNLLQLGSFLYILGFPKGYAMVTRGLASSSESWNDRFFVTDAIFNPGISGGPVMASRDNFRSLELVGIVSSATASREDVLVPRPNNEKYSRRSASIQRLGIRRGKNTHQLRYCPGRAYQPD
ncbi:MAG: serine protease [Fodinibius sp.]|nr:serine protease [Fodinibius sp.]